MMTAPRSGRGVNMDGMKKTRVTGCINNAQAWGRRVPVTDEDVETAHVAIVRP